MSKITMARAYWMASWSRKRIREEKLHPTPKWRMAIHKRRVQRRVLRLLGP
jgi:hypothetical protein